MEKVAQEIKNNQTHHCTGKKNCRKNMEEGQKIDKKSEEKTGEPAGMWGGWVARCAPVAGSSMEYLYME
jgi:hypothetical protein